MKYNKILKKLKLGEINSEEALNYLSDKGYCANLLNDDNGRWAVSFNGFQTVPVDEGSADISTFFFIESRYWKDTIKDALIFAMEIDNETI